MSEYHWKAFHRDLVRAKRISNFGMKLTLPWKCRWNGWIVIVVGYLIWGKPRYKFELIQNDGGLEFVCWHRTEESIREYGNLAGHRVKLLLFRIGGLR